MAKYITCHRRGSATQWAEKNTIIPLEGEIVIEIDEINSLHKLKIGDGIHTYAELAYLQAGDEIVTQVLAEAKPRIVTIELTTNWTQVSNEKYSQEIELENITKNSRLDLQPNADILAEFKQLGLAFVTENNGGIITVYSVGNMPLKSYTIQSTIVEMECNNQDTVVGIPIGVGGVSNTDVPDEIYVGDGDMPEDATIQIVLDAEDEEQALKDDLKDYIDTELLKAQTSGEFDGKSAYEYAQEGGYTGTEAEFTQALGSLGSDTPTEVNSWSMVQQLVRLGIASRVFKIGDQLVCNHDEFGTLVWDIIGIDHDIPANSEYQHSLTLQLHDSLNAGKLEFDVAELTNPDENRGIYGSNDWITSNIRQWLNSDGDAGVWWEPTTEYDEKPRYAFNPGFLKGLDAEFLSTIGEVFKTTARNIITDNRGYDTVAEKFFLLSRTEVYGGLNYDIAEGEPYPYYADNSILSAPGVEEDTNRIKYQKNGNACVWWLRSPAVNYTYAVGYVQTSGKIVASYADSDIRLVPACCIV